MSVDMYFKKHPGQQLAQLFRRLNRISLLLLFRVYVMLEAAEMWKNGCLLRLTCQVTKVKYTGEKLRSCFYKTSKDYSFNFFYIGLKRFTFKVIQGLC